VPIVFVHGVAVRDSDDPQHGAVERITRGTEWPVIEALLREHVAPVVRALAPAEVQIVRVYWGDLGTPPWTPPAVESAGAAYETAEHLDDLSVEVLGSALEAQLFAALPPHLWPAAVRAVWAVARDSALPAQLAARSPRRQRGWLEGLVRDRLATEAPELREFIRPMAADLSAQTRRNVRRAMGEVRRPLESVVPIFVGDVLGYVAGRGRPGEPGPVVARVIEALVAAAAARAQPEEPLVVLTHSMGGQILYDVLTAFAPDVPGGLPRVDFWCSAGSQVGLFAQLGVFLDTTTADSVTLDEGRVGYFWNAWSSSDMLSFPAEGRVVRAHDSDFAFPGGPTSAHLAYLTSEAFYRTFAAKIEAHCQPRALS
jgi:hypothetical protein